MKRPLSLVPFLCLVLLAGESVRGQVSDLLPPQRRAVTVALARKLMKPRELAPLPDKLQSPFNPTGFNQPVPSATPAQPTAATPAAPVAPPTAQDVLDTLAKKIVPSGILRIGGQSILLFGQKKLKVGDQLIITFEGVDYTLDITAIGNTTFTLRLNNEEITRPINPRKKP